MSALEELQKWYSNQCDGEWEHRYGVSINTIDTPGWAFSVELGGTKLAEVPFTELWENYEVEHDWLICGRNANAFVGHCGPLKLETVIRVFLDWAASISE